MDPIITSILDVDLYKISMLQAYFHQYPSAKGRWVFKCRNEGVKLGFLCKDVKDQVRKLKNLELSKEEKVYLKSLGYFKDDFLNWFEEFRVRPSLVSITENQSGQLEIEAEGLLIEVNILEVYILAIVNELYFRHKNLQDDFYLNKMECDGMKTLRSKIDKLSCYPNLKFAEFGTRRRYSKEWQDKVIKTLVDECPNIIGTSNVYYAKKYGIKPIGTVAHEWTMSHLGLVDKIEQAQSRALYVWQQEYDQALGIALTDTFTSKAFFKDFKFPVARAYDGVRQDSGDPIVFGEDMISHYKSIGIDPRRKSIIFSDGLNVNLSIEIWKHFVGRVGVSFGIGTNLTNDLYFEPLNIVMKLMNCNGVPVVKLSDNPGKAMGDKLMIEKVKRAYGVNDDIVF